jgi:REP element-mobilizing transposase RayT
MAYYSRKTTRIPGYDYSSNNYYFVTICTYNKKCIFGTSEQLNKFGEIAKAEMDEISSHYAGVYIDNFIIMPNHVHAIVVIDCGDESGNKPRLDHVIGLYKSGVSRKIRKIQPDMKVWQRSFHDHIIRNRHEYEQIWRYVQHNDQKWETDCFYCKADV